jgi:hypothetical protein
MSKLGCYYHNFPFSLTSNINLELPLITETVLGRTTIPAIVYIGHGDELDFENIKSHPDKELLKSTGIEIFLFEWFRYYSLSDKVQFDGCNQIQFDENQHSKLRTKILDIASKFVEEEGINITINCCEANITKYISSSYPNLKLQCLDFQNQTEAVGYFINAGKVNFKSKISYKFWCATNRFTNYRQLVMSYLADKSGKYSWPFLCNFICDDVPWLKNLPWEYLKKGNDILNNTDFFVDVEVEKIIVNDYLTAKIADFPCTWDKNLNNFLKSYEECFVAIVNESVFFQPTCTVTEKTFDAMITLTPFIIVGGPLTLKYLKDLGFKTFDKWWDESYDTEMDHAERLIKIFKLIDYINSLSIEQLFAMYKEMSHILEWNREHFLTFYSRDIILP